MIKAQLCDIMTCQKSDVVVLWLLLALRLQGLAYWIVLLTGQLRVKCRGRIQKFLLREEA